MKTKKTLHRIAAMVMAACLCTPGVPTFAALQSSPTWYDSNGVGVAPDWHYRVPLTVPASGSVGTTAVISIDFAALLTQLNVSGTLDTNSIRVVRPTGALATVQEYTPGIYNGANNATTGRGEVRFLIEDAAGTYQVYFDITANGSKPANPQTPINGNFEVGAAGTMTPAGWTSASAATGYDAQIRPSETPSIATNGTVAGNGTSPRTVDGTPYTGSSSYLLGARTNNEGANGFPTVTLVKTINVPATNPGNLIFRYRIQGWDSNQNGSTTQFDYFAADLSATGVTTANMVGPTTNAYGTYPFSPNYGIVSASATKSGYGQYNGWDTDTTGTHRGTGASFTTLTRGAEPWFTVTYPLTAFAGKTATLKFSFSDTTQYKSWAHVDDVEWSVVTPTLGSPQAAGIVINLPSTSPATALSTALYIKATVDAAPVGAVYVDVLNASGTTVASNIRLFNDGTHGSSVAAPSIWINDGSDTVTYPTYTVPATGSWTVRGRNPEGSTSLNGATYNGLIERIGQPVTPASEADYFNVADGIFAVSTGKAMLSNVKEVAMFSDPVNGLVNPKAIPGSKVVYTVTISNTGGGSVDMNSVYITDPIPANTKLSVVDFASAGQGPVRFTDGTPSSSLNYTFTSLASSTDSVSFSDNGGVSYTYTPVADADGCDAAVTHVRVQTNGTMPAATSGGTPNFKIEFKVGIK